jgi:hypothetical protein
MKFNLKHNLELKAETAKGENNEEKKTSFPALTVALTVILTITLSLAIYFRLDVHLAVDYLLTNRPQTVAK